MLFLFLSVKLNNFFSSGLNGVEEHHHCTGFRAGTGSRAIPDRENGEHPQTERKERSIRHAPRRRYDDVAHFIDQFPFIHIISFKVTFCSHILRATM